jgi:hypothetical protein
MEEHTNCRSGKDRMMRLRSLNGVCAAVAVAAVALLAGCGASDAPAVPFATAQGGTGPVSIEGVPDTSTMRKETGKPTEFMVKEADTDQSMRVSAPPEVSVPANLSSATFVVVTGTYNAEQRTFVATRVETKVPPREAQPRG